jgi:formylmethanofuran dehydrogenase subunit A
LSFYEIAIVTRAGQAKALGLKNKGHLGLGADADIAIYNFNPEKTDPSRKYKTARRAFKQAAYTIKGGEIVSQNGQIIKSVNGTTMWADIEVSHPAEVTEDFKKRFREYWTVEFENYPVSPECLKASTPIRVEAKV